MVIKRAAVLGRFAVVRKRDSWDVPQTADAPISRHSGVFLFSPILIRTMIESGG